MASFTFDADRPRATRAAERQAAAMVREISDETRQALRALVARAIREQIPPFEAARIIAGMVGLTSRQAMAAMNFREDLVNQGLALDKVDQQMARYVKRKIRERSRMISRTEIITALSRGQDEAWSQAKSDGFLDDTMVEEWIVTPDDRLCPICGPMAGQTTDIGETFTTGDGRQVKRPGSDVHPQCRCAKGLANRD